MSAISVEQAIDSIYKSLQKDNEDINDHIKILKEAMKQEDVKEAKFQSDRLVQNNREGRKRMQSYFKKRGVKVIF